MTTRAQNHIVIILCTIIYLSLQVCITILDMKEIRAFSGVIMAFQFVACLVMIRRDELTGLKVTIVLMGLSMINMLRILLVLRVITPLPGIFNISIYIFTLTVISYQFRIRKKEAVTDFLTGLSNRRGLVEILETRVEEKKPFSIIFISLDNIKKISDNYGIIYMEKLLKEITLRLNKIVPANCQLARLGNDCFVLVAGERCDEKQLVNDMLDAICKKAVIEVDGIFNECYVKVNAGISRFPDDAGDMVEIMKHADLAMEQARKDETERYYQFDERMEKTLKREMELEGRIKEGLEHERFYLMYQPQYLLNGKKLRGFEALIRMKTHDGQKISPSEFIPVAEKSDLILQIDDYVLKRAMTEFKEAAFEKGITISVNVSAKNFSSDDFVDKVKGILDETGFKPDNLEIEITEYCLVESVDMTVKNIEKLHALGVHTALDDFGTGYTSLSYLSKMPIDLLKLDKSLIDNIINDEKSADFVNAIIYMGHIMNCEVISEGVESTEQLEKLKDLECDLIQGFVWGRPVELEVAKSLT